ncbi:hypothetical protein [Marinimicrobium sp. LS-A18]|uniref:hypothetical protein n=1 Tax=Marinimicrobium sp. LS-A18 TaxID=1381596 RepID=UPI00126971D6|nr:hypothetical protein [Marinimicrobium sp. LS-A18]
MIRKFVFGMALVGAVSGCAPMVVEGVCAIDAAIELPDLDKRNFQYTISLTSGAGSKSLQREFTCEGIKRVCLGGNWAVKYEMTKGAGNMDHEFSSHKSIRFKPPTCYSATRNTSVPDEPVLPYSTELVVGGDTFNLKFKDLTSPNSVSAVGVQVIGYELQEK